MVDVGGHRVLPAAVVLLVASVGLIGCSGSKLHQAAPKVASAGPGIDRAAANYLAIAIPANAELEASLDALDGRDHRNLAAARGRLLDVVRTERAFDRVLLAVALPAALADTAQSLVRVNESRAELTARAAAAVTLRVLWIRASGLSAANALVEQQVETLRAQLGLAPPDPG